DLYYRLNVIRLETPPLRARTEDMPLLAEYLVEQICRRQGIPVRGISADAIERLRRHAWPGNVRELSNVLERALLMSDGDVLEAADLERVMPPPTVPAPATGRAGADAVGLAEAVAHAERNAIVAAIDRCHGNKAQAARLLGISRAALYEKIAALGL
ncbi:MAG: sigma-54-dependent Fis family transcriptional regulator, partial [Proteobacteria bacterium]|nr:sigma-54-dependent Fis family transcriptional regulator [Pseudomonadota bacterium]